MDTRNSNSSDSSTAIVKTNEAVLSFVLWKIEQLYYEKFPVMFAGSPQGIDLALLHYHELWAFMTGQWSLFTKVWHESRAAAGAPEIDFCGHFAREHPEVVQGPPTERRHEWADYIIENWRNISSQLSVPLSREHYEAVNEEFINEFLGRTGR